MSIRAEKKELLKVNVGWIICLVFMIFIFSPLELYVSNVNEFCFSLKEIIWVLFLCGGIVLLLAGAAILIIPLKMGKGIFFLAALLDILFYVQYFLNGRMGLLDGTEKFSRQESAINYLIWLIFIGGG